MAKSKARPLGLDGTSTPAQEDEADIIEEVGAERDEESGDLLASEDAIAKIGAVDAESVIENRRMNTAVGKKRANVPNAQFNTDNVLEKYEFIIRSWPPNTIDISMKRLTGTPVQHVITSRPRSQIELYEALMAVHGQYEEAKYAIRFTDSNAKCFRGTGQITLPDTRPKTVQGPNMAYPPPYGYPPPGYPPPPPGYPQQPPQAQPPQGAAQPAPPIYVQPPAGPDMGSMIGSLEQLLGMVQKMQQPGQPQVAPAAPPFAMPPPPATPDMGSMVAWMQQMFDLVQRMQPAQPVQAAPTRGGQPMPAPQMAPVPPPFPTPPGMLHVPGIGYVSYEALMQAMQGGPAPGRPPPYRSSHRPYDEPPPYARAPEGYDPRRAPEAYDPRQQSPYGQRMYGGGPPPPPKSMGDQLREALGVVQEAVSAVKEMETILPQPAAQEHEAPEPRDDDGPRVDQVGSARVVRNDDGTIRPWESILANSDKIFKAAGDAFKEIQASQREQSAQQHAQQSRARLPEGTVVVTEGFVPPPGFVAVPIDQIPPQHHRAPQHRPPPQQQGLAPAPSFVPPAVQSPPGPRAWETVEGES